jgi:hypothetical protein
MLVSATINRAPTLLYFAQELGEPGAGDAGFGKASRSSIFDYWGVPAQQRWNNHGAFDGGASTPAERSLREFYSRLLSYTATSPAMRGAYAEIHSLNRAVTPGYDDRLFAFTRWSPEKRVLVVANFRTDSSYQLNLEIPLDVVANWHLDSGMHTLVEQLGSGLKVPMVVSPQGASVPITLPPLAAYLFELEK